MSNTAVSKQRRRSAGSGASEATHTAPSQPGSGVNERTTIYFRDVYDHLVRIYEQIDTNRDLLGNAMDAWLSVVANRTNDITKQLTILASIFLPLSFVVGFFGQNFDVLGTPPFFYAMVSIMVLVPLGMIAWFKHKEWW